ncbi:hypothetical protein IscW_ISCW005395 [Ixodes scapularis]|uniref:Uncharacterized protein n=1 Tax=Ixodes scapularis TaxID=6945 RepID=B7PMN2_IXOSC|nr:hypothetical protein IscW_ISCW005395 [Ixodes scapularis]|eukprot:XP_002435030.1 hypothetical protein IscW_ISCW005395 [Ixodes scapularis]
MHLVHHMLVYGCRTPGYREWDNVHVADTVPQGPHLPDRLAGRLRLGQKCPAPAATRRRWLEIRWKQRCQFPRNSSSLCRHYLVSG